MNILIVEDEELAVKKLTKILQDQKHDIEIVGVTDSIADSVQWLRTNPVPDLILMDIELADGQSFEIFNQVEVKSAVIFTTSYDEYALKAFKVNSIDYLLKPIQPDELATALDKFVKLQGQALPQAAVNMEQLIEALHQKLQPKVYRQRFLVKHANKMLSVEVGDIAYFYSDGRVNFFKTNDNRRIMIDYTLDELEDMLDPAQFFRINRAFYISIPCVERIDDYFGNRLILSLKPQNDKEALVSREKVSDFKRWMGK
ncbi:MAG TPA: LytTR family DNA-binding domain-containing protein [Saprospiraceae bacterium]|nr:LytTR family DNA-binding domain-containing protein [Saprospiraceae bacterium]